MDLDPELSAEARDAIEQAARRDETSSELLLFYPDPDAPLTPEQQAQAAAARAKLGPLMYLGWIWTDSLSTRLQSNPWRSTNPGRRDGPKAAFGCSRR